MLLRSFIERRLHLSTKQLRSLKFRDDGILVNGEHATGRRRLCAGDDIRLATEDSTSSEKIHPVDLPLDILLEDEHLVVPSKPAAMPTHPSHDHYDDTVANALAFRYREMGVPFVFRPINRLDRTTSGLLLIARSRLAASRLTDAMQAGEFQKLYLAVLDGVLPCDEGVIDAPLHRTAESIIVRETCSPDAPDADPARTEYRVLARSDKHTLVEARPITGRTHQLRVHFSYVGAPIAGDTLYGTCHADIPTPARQALHAYSLTFPHPTTGLIMTVIAPLGEDLRAFLPDHT